MDESQPQTVPSFKLSTLSQRLIVAILIVAGGCSLIYIGGWTYLGFVCILMGIAAWEYWRMYQDGGFRPSAPLLIVGTMALSATRYLWGFDTTPALFTLFALITLGIQVFDYRNAGKTAAVDFAVNLGGLLYVGWMGAYLVSLRTLPDGMWWTLLVVPATGFVDGGAYLFGSLFGKHKMAPLISPNKTWEGYFGGVFSGILAGVGLAALWHLRAPSILPWHGLVIGAAIGLLTPIGDLGESVLKRGFGVKDTGSILPGHGGILDRIDSWLWAVPIGYYLIRLFFGN